MYVNYLVVLEDARSISGQAGTWTAAIMECRRIAAGWHVRYSPAIMFFLSDGTVHRHNTDLDMLVDDGTARDEQIIRVERSMRDALEAPSWGRIHQHERNGKTIPCNDGTNCRRMR
jgi:hypothetical protein